MKKGANKLRESDPTHDTTEEPPVPCAAGSPEWQETVDGILRCKPCNKVLDDQHLGTDAHKVKLDRWLQVKVLEADGYKAPELPYLAWVPCEGQRQLMCLLCRNSRRKQGTWVSDETAHCGTHENPAGSKEHRKNLLNYPPGDPWYEQNVTAARLEFHPKLEVSRAKTASESRPEIRSEDASFSESGFRPDKSQQTQSLSGYRDEAHCTYPSRDVEKLVEEQPEVAAGAAAWLDGERQRSPERTERQDPQAQVAANAAEPAAEAKVAPEPKLPPNWRSAKDSEGTTYYYHVKERKSQWDFPEWPHT